MSNAVVPPGKPIKLVVWDLDDALWSAAGDPALRRAAGALITALDERGILQSCVTARADAPARALVRELGIADYLLVPQLGAPASPAAVAQIAQALNLAIDATLVVGDRVDDAFAAAQIRGVAPARIVELAGDPLMGHSLAAIEPRPRRLLYVEEQARAAAERGFAGSREAFLAGLGMKLALAPATRGDLHRVRELVTRTNQLGVTYRDDELVSLIDSPRHACWLVSLADRFGDCGKVGLAVVELAAGRWTLQLLQFSCRVLPRGVDTLVLHALARRARAAEVRLCAELRLTRKNEAMLAAYHRAGFALVEQRGDLQVLAWQPHELPPPAAGVEIRFAHPSSPS